MTAEPSARKAAAACYPPSEPLEVELPAGKVVEGLTVVLKPGAVLAGRVLTEDGNPVADARVRAHGGSASSARCRRETS